MGWTLLVDDDLSSTFPPREVRFGPPDVGAVISEAIGSVGDVEITVRDVGPGDGPSFAELQEYDHVVWATGQAPVSTGPFDENSPVENTLTFDDSNALTRYTDGGGKLFLTGMDAFYLDENSAFVTDTLGLEVTGDCSTSTFEGAAASPFAGDRDELTNPPFAIPFYHDGLTPAKPNASALGTIGTPPDSEEYLSGNSMSAPYTTGTAALAAGEFPNLLERPTALKRLVMATGQPAPLTRGKTLTGDLEEMDLQGEVALSGSHVERGPVRTGPLSVA